MASWEIPQKLILTKTHFLGFMHECPDSIDFMPESFRGNFLSEFNMSAAYPIELVKKAVQYIMRHPLDNIVSRFNYFTSKAEYPRNREGFLKWCQNMDAGQEIKCENLTRVRRTRSGEEFEADTLLSRLFPLYHMA